jgi:superfamily II DNA or RNA helicase
VIPSGIRDNHHRGAVGDFLRQALQPGVHVAIVSAYFTIYAYEKLQRQLDSIASLKFLFGDPQFLRNLDPARDVRRVFQIENDQITLQNRLQQKRLARECAEWITQKVEIRSVKRAGLLHGKLYHIDNQGLEQAILGSSNFTVRGLGLGDDKNNIELNLVVDSRRDHADLKQWFNEIWDDANLVTDVRDEVLGYLQQIYANHSPEFIYFKTLFHLFEQYLDDQRRSNLLATQSQIADTEIWNALFEFQRDGVKGAITRILKHNGCIIADSVGLGKTYEALAVIKYFELRNDKVLVLCPKKLRDNWTVYQAHNNSPLNPFVRDRLSYTVLSHTDLSRDGGHSGDIDLGTLNWGNYDLIVIDESHNFRNNARGRRDEEGRVIRRTRYERLMEDIIKSGVKTKVLLLSATPVNNDLKDLRNQLYFLTEDRDDAFREGLGIPSLKDALATAQRTFTEWSKHSEHQTSDLMARLSAAFFTLLDEVTIARSRKHIQRYYSASIAQLGGFPERARPLAIYPEIDRRGRFMSYDRLNDEILQYRLSLFNPSVYVRPEFQARYERSSVRNFSQAQRETYLIGMMKVNFLKRLESSIAAFALTMERTIAKIEALEQKITDFQRRPTAGTEVEADPLPFDTLDPEDEELRDALTVGQSLKFQLAHLDLDAWLADLRRDKQQLDLLLSSAQGVTVPHDAKLHELREIIRAKATNPPRNKLDQPNRKVLVFTAFADTAVYLYDALRDWARSDLGIHIALVSGGAAANRTSLGRADFNHILTNFSPVSKRRAQIPQLPQDEQIDLLIATDCISEGQNLQDCDLVINYDIHWNPVRIIQRFGRIDRIGSVNHAVQLVNFWPTQDLNKYINLKSRVEARMALVDLTATGDDNLLSADNLEELIAEDLRYRDRQLLRLKDEVLDLEDFNQTVALTDFSLDDFRVDLSKFLEQSREQLRKEPIGLYAVVDHGWSRYDIAKPGVIFCLRHVGATPEGQTVNPLQPFYLVYVRDDGTVRFGFAQPKQTLELFRDLCLGHPNADDALCALFDRDTADGVSMGRYSDLLGAAVRDIDRRFRGRAAERLQLDRGALLVPEPAQARHADDFELITWLVIR